MALLTPLERETFLLWLDEEAVTDDGLATQMEAISMVNAVARHYRAKAAAKRMVAQDLRSTVEMNY